MKKRSKDSFFGDVLDVFKNDLGRAPRHDNDPIDEDDVCPEDELEDVPEPDSEELRISEDDLKNIGPVSEAEMQRVYAELKRRGDKPMIKFIGSLIKTADELRYDADLSKETIKSMEKDHKKLLEDIKSLEKRINDFVKLRQLSEELLEENDKLKKENDDLKKQLKENTGDSEAEKQLDGAQKCVEGLNQQIEELKKQLAEQTSQLQAKDAEVSRMLDREEELQDQLKEHRVDIAEKDTELRRLSQEVTSRGIEIQQLREEIKLVEAAVPKKKKKFYFRFEDTNHMNPLTIDEVKEIMANYPKLKTDDIFEEYLLPVDYKGDLIVPYVIPEKPKPASPKTTSKKDNKAASKAASNPKAGEPKTPTA